LLDVRVHLIRDVRIYLFSALKRAIAIADDVEVPEVKIGCEPRIGHVPIMKDRLQMVWRTCASTYGNLHLFAWEEWAEGLPCSKVHTNFEDEREFAFLHGFG
jgi:hypothetical protein